MKTLIMDITKNWLNRKGKKKRYIGELKFLSIITYDL